MCITFILFFSLLTSLNGVFLRSIFFGIVWFYITYWLLSIFIFLYKKSQIGVYTSIIQRFWKRALYLFWILELFLFIIYLFLTLISPQEPLYMQDMFYLYINYVSNLKPFFINLFKIIVLILGFNILLLSIKYNSFNLYLSYCLLIGLLIILNDDFAQFYTLHQFYQYNSWKFEVEVRVWELEMAELKFRTGLHYFYILGFLKFFHTLFIVIFFIFFENLSFFTKNSSFNTISASLQNLYFLLFFSFILKILFLKYFMNLNFDSVYYWFYVNNHYYSNNTLFYLFPLKHIFYIYFDLINYLD